MGVAMYSNEQCIIIMDVYDVVSCFTIITKVSLITDTFVHALGKHGDV